MNSTGNMQITFLISKILEVFVSFGLFGDRKLFETSTRIQQHVELQLFFCLKLPNNETLLFLFFQFQTKLNFFLVLVT